MAPLTIYRDSDVSSTVVSNLFIDEYMGAANDAQLKIYLYLLRMMNAQLATSVSDIADKFNHTEKDVVRALKYWERLKLISLNYDEDKNLTGIHIRDLTAKEVSERKPRPSATFVPMPASASEESEAGCPGGFSAGLQTAGHGKTPTAAIPATIAASADKPAASSAEPAARFEKPAFSADQIREFRNRQDTAQLLFIAETYIGKPLTPSEIKSLLFFTDTLQFSEDLIDYLLQYCVERDKKNFRYIEKVAVSWAEEGITTPEQAQAASAGYDKRVYSIMKALGKNSAPTDTELSFINRWTADYAFHSDIIFEACRRTVLNTDKNRFQYADRMLSMWKEQNVQSTGDILKLDEAYHQNKKTGGRTSEAGPVPHKPVNRFNQFTQNTYDFDALEKKLLSN